MKRSFLVVTAMILSLVLGRAAFAAEPRPPAELKKILDAPPPDPTATPQAELLKIYLVRAQAAAVLGDIDRQLRELNEAIRLVGPKDPLSYLLYDLVGRTLVETGDFRAARSMRDHAFQVTNDRGSKFYFIRRGTRRWSGP